MFFGKDSFSIVQDSKNHYLCFYVNKKKINAIFNRVFAIELFMQ